MTVNLISIFGKPGWLQEIIIVNMCGDHTFLQNIGMESLDRLLLEGFFQIVFVKI